MKSAIFVVLLAACCISLAVGRPQRECPTICTADYSPVCGRDRNGNTREFSNSCQLGVHNCQNPGNVYTRC